MAALKWRSQAIAAAVGLAVVYSNAIAGGFVDQIARHHLEQKLQSAETQFSPAGILNWSAGASNGLVANGLMGAFTPDEPASNGKAISGVFTQKLDPSNAADTRAFSQRYFFVDSFASGPDAPVFYYICGEGACEGVVGLVVTLARQYHGYAFALEHRFYGQSQPFPRLSPDNLRYLRTEFALADLANFEVFAQNKWGLKGKWISIGGSYPGSLSAFYRLKYPNLVAGALASSAPVQPRENFELYDWVVNDRAGPQCASAIRNVVAILENAMRTNPAQFENAKKIFTLSTIQDPVDFLYIVADMAASAVQYGMKDSFCAALLKAGNDPVGAYARAGIAAFAQLGMKPVDDSFMAAMNEDPASYGSGVGMRQWLYQSCTEFGYFQNAYHDPAYSTRSALINPAFHQKICQELFPGTPPLNVAKIQKYFYEPLLNPSTSRILFTNGSIDPWATLSIAPGLGNTTNPNLTEFMIQGSAHCDDLDAPRTTDSTSLQQARALFNGMLSQWLK